MEQNRLVLRVMSESEDDTAKLARMLKEQLGDKGTIKTVTRDAPVVPGRAIDPASAIQVIELSLVAVGTATTVIQAINSFKTGNTGVTIAIANQKTGSSIHVSGADPDSAVDKKVCRVMKKKGFLSRLFRR
jgi:hypothetical protein